MYNYLNIISNSLKSLSTNSKILSVILMDIFFCVILLYLSFYLRTNEFPVISFDLIILAVISGITLIFFFWVLGITKEVIRYSNFNILIKCGQSIFCYSIAFYLFSFFLEINNVPRSIYIIQPILLFVYAILIRIQIKYFLNTFTLTSKDDFISQNVLIYGANETGIILSNIIATQRKFKFLGFIEDNEQLIGRTVNGKNIYSYDNAIKLILKKKINSIIFAFQGLKEKNKQKLINNFINKDISISTASQFINKLIWKNFFLDENEIDLLTLIGRKEIEPNKELLSKNILNKCVLVTGAGGSIGSELSRQISKLQPSKLILFDNNEFALYKIDKHLKNYFIKNNLKIKLISLLGCVTDQTRIYNIFEKYNPFIVFHAAAYKHVPIVEDNPGEAIKVNIFGTNKLLKSVKKYKSPNFDFCSGLFLVLFPLFEGRFHW